MLEPSASEALQNHDWPGNIRELQSLITATATRYADVEHLFPMHLNTSPDEGLVSPVPRMEAPDAVVADRVAPWASLLHLLSQVKGQEVPPAELSRTYREIEEGLYRARAMLLRAALEATRRRTPACPEGEILIHPAVKLLLGSSEISASKAADIIKRILTSPGKHRRVGLDDPVLADALDRASRLRPGFSQGKSKNIEG